MGVVIHAQLVSLLKFLRQIKGSYREKYKATSSADFEASSVWFHWLFLLDLQIFWQFKQSRVVQSFRFELTLVFHLN